MSIFDKFLDISPLTFQITTKFSAKTQINPKKHTLLEGELVIKTKEHTHRIKYFKIMDRKLLCSSNKESTPLFYYDLMHFLKIDYDKTQSWFTLEKLNQKHEFSSTDNAVVKKFINILKLYCISNDFQNKYKILDVLGKGHFSQVYRVKHLESGNFLAAKHIKLQSLKEEYKAYIFREIKILKSLPKNSHIIKLYEVYEQQHEIILIFEFMTEGDLYHKIKIEETLSETQICSLFCQILKGLIFLHSNGVVHRDIKPDNILLTKNKQNSQIIVKIADFSLAEYFHEKKLNAICGTPGYMAPEIFTEDEYDEKVDVYSLGIILYMMFTKKPPFHGKTSKEVLEKNKNGEIKFKKKEWGDISHCAKKLVASLVAKYPGQRLSLQNIFCQKWIRKHYYETLQTETVQLMLRSEHKKPDNEEYKKHPLEFYRSQSEILDIDNDYHVPTERSTEGITDKSKKYIFEPPKNKFINISDYLPSKLSVSENENNYSSKKIQSAYLRPSLRVTNEFKENMNLNSVNSLFIGSRSSFTSDFLNMKSKSSLSEEISNNKYNFGTGLTKKDANDSGLLQLNSLFDKSIRNEFTLFNKMTNIFTEPIKEISWEENTNKTNQTMEYEESPIHILMAELMAESKPIRPSKKF